jgi:hypothetical protein
MGSKILFWVAAAMAAMGMHSAEGNLFYFFAVHSSMLMVGTSLYRREKRGRKPAPMGASSAKPAPADSKSKPV